MKKLLLVAATVLAFGLAGCEAKEVKADQNYPLKMYKQNRTGKMETWRLFDEDTGVNYIVVGTKFSDTQGQPYDGVTIFPRLNADGTLFTSSK